MSGSPQRGRRVPGVPSPDPLVPWAIREDHRWARPLGNLQSEVRRRAGFEMRAADLERLAGFRAELAERELVVHYEPRTERGWWLVPRRPEIDRDLIREPVPVAATRRFPAALRERHHTPILAFTASLIRTKGRDTTRPGAAGDPRVHTSSTYGGALGLISVRRSPLGTWMVYLVPNREPGYREFIRAVRQSTREWEINWETGPFFDEKGHPYYDAVPRPGSIEFRRGVKEGTIDRPKR